MGPVEAIHELSPGLTWVAMHPSARGTGKIDSQKASEQSRWEQIEKIEFQMVILATQRLAKSF